MCVPSSGNDASFNCLRLYLNSVENEDGNSPRSENSMELLTVIRIF